MPMGGVMPGATPAAAAPEVSPGRGPVQEEVFLCCLGPTFPHVRVLSTLILGLHQSTHATDVCASGCGLPVPLPAPPPCPLGTMSQMRGKNKLLTSTM